MLPAGDDAFAIVLRPMGREGAGKQLRPWAECPSNVREEQERE